MANLSPLQQKMNRAHSDDGSSCLPNCWRWHQGDPDSSLRKCNWCDKMLENDTKIIIAHNEWHLTHPDSFDNINL